MKNIMELKNISFRYDDYNKNSVEDVNFTIKKAEVVFLVGNSGAGKSTLLNIINGIIPEVIEGDLKGELIINERDDLKIYEKSLILGNVFQNPRSQFFTTNTTSELVFQMENYGYKIEIIRDRLDGIVNKFKVQNLLDREIFNLSSGERQFLALLTAMIMDPEVIVFDEPSANLDYGNAMRLKRQIQKFKEEGKTVIISDHRCFYLRGILDKVLLIENGTVKIFDSESEFIDYDYGNRVFDLFSFEYPNREVVKSNITDVRLENISYGEILKDINISFNKNEVATIVGVNGVGKTTLSKIISKLIKADKGVVDIKGKALYIMQDADFQLFGSTCLKELEITQRDMDRNIKALELLNLIGLKDKHPQSLSGGEKQRLQMAISMVSENDVIILDEPTSGLDKNSMNRVIEMIEILKKDRTIIVISHDYEFIRKCTDRIVYIKDSKIKDEFYLENSNIEKLNKIYIEMEGKYEQK